MGLGALRSCCLRLWRQKLFFNWYSGGGGVESNWVHTVLRPPIGLLCQPRVIMMMEKLVEWWLVRKPEVLGENLAQCRFVHHKTHMLPRREPWPPRWEASDGAALRQTLDVRPRNRPTTSCRKDSKVSKHQTAQWMSLQDTSMYYTITWSVLIRISDSISSTISRLLKCVYNCLLL
jgi:hypothetical protein